MSGLVTRLTILLMISQNSHGKANQIIIPARKDMMFQCYLLTDKMTYLCLIKEKFHGILGVCKVFHQLHSLTGILLIGTLKTKPTPGNTI